ncbi:MAG TPA: DUF2987 domain-containing protein [Luteimonas sp.]|nr:DUF2987 domain-containing protein [Luteimonas sp.]
MNAWRWICGSLMLASLAVHAAEWREVPYKDLARMQVMLDKVDTDRVFASRYEVAPAKGGKTLPADLKIEVLVSGTSVPVKVGPEGGLYLPARQDWIDAGAKLRVNQPKGTLKVSYHFKARTPPGTRMSYAKLTESVQVMERGIKQAAGWMGFLVPKPRALGVTFEPGPAQEVVVILADGSRKRYRAQPKTGEDGPFNALEVPWNPDWLKAQVELSAPAVAVVPLLD